MKEVVFKNQQALQDWVLLDEKPSEKNSVKNISSENEEYLIDWTYVSDQVSEDYDETNVIHSNDPQKINSYRIDKINELFENF